MAQRHALSVALALILFTAPASGAAEDCTRCLVANPETERPLTIEIVSGIQFSRLALTGQGNGAAEIDPQTGSKRTDGGMVDLGGTAFQGRGRITGTPLRTVRIDLPPSVEMRSADGSVAELSRIETDLPAIATLDASGVLEFSFGGQIKVSGNQGGTFRARIPISVDYN